MIRIKKELETDLEFIGFIPEIIRFNYKRMERVEDGYRIYGTCEYLDGGFVGHLNIDKDGNYTNLDMWLNMSQGQKIKPVDSVDIYKHIYDLNLLEEEDLDSDGLFDVVIEKIDNFFDNEVVNKLRKYIL